MNRLLILTLTLIATLRAEPATNRLENLTLDQALALAEAQHPDLAEARALAEAAAGRAQQAGKLPNPELIARLEAAPLGDAASSQANYLGGVAQAIPLGGRLSKAKQAEHLDHQRLTREIEAKRRDLHRRIHGAFATALYQERAQRVQSDIHTAAEKTVTLTRVRVQAGDAPAEDLARAELEALLVRGERERSRALREQALIALAGALGMPGLAIASLEGELDATFELPTLEILAASLAANPALAAVHADVAAGEARVLLARAARVPDVRVEVLYRRLEADQRDTFDVGVSLPLPLFDRGQGRLRAARAEWAAAEARSRATAVELDQRLRGSYAELTAALERSRAFKTEILPRAETVLKAAETRYEAGDISLAELLPVRRDFALARLGYLESLRDVMRVWAEVKSLSNPR